MYVLYHFISIYTQNNVPDSFVRAKVALYYCDCQKCTNKKNELYNRPLSRDFILNTFLMTACDRGNN